MSLRVDDFGMPFARGHTADFYRWPYDDELVVKLYPAGFPTERIGAEERACGEVFRAGATPIRCHGQFMVENRLGLIFDRVHGDSLANSVRLSPWRRGAMGRVLARVHARLHEAVTGFLPDVRVVAAAALDDEALAFLEPSRREWAKGMILALPAGDRILHMGFRPGIVFRHDDDYVALDWTRALRGHPAVDVATTLLLHGRFGHMAGAGRGTSGADRTTIRAYRAEYLSISTVTHEDLNAWMLPAVVLRLVAEAGNGDTRYLKRALRGLSS